MRKGTKKVFRNVMSILIAAMMVLTLVPMLTVKANAAETECYHFDTEWVYLLDGEEVSLDEIPCNTSYIERYVCLDCDEVLNEYPYNSYHSNEQVCVVDGKEVEFKDVPCETYYQYYYKCTKCGETTPVNESKKSHSGYIDLTYKNAETGENCEWEDIPCEAEYIEVFTCSYCEEEVEVKEDKKEHATYNSEVYYKVADKKYEDYTDVYDNAPCNSLYGRFAVCEKCEKEVNVSIWEEQELLGHRFDESVTYDAEGNEVSDEDLVCGAGYITVSKCEKCDYESMYAYVLGHDYIYDFDKELYICRRCDEEIETIDDEEEPDHEHKYVDVYFMDGKEVDELDIPCLATYNSVCKCEVCDDVLYHIDNLVMRRHLRDIENTFMIDGKEYTYDEFREYFRTHCSGEYTYVYECEFCDKKVNGATSTFEHGGLGYSKRGFLYGGNLVEFKDVPVGKGFSLIATCVACGKDEEIARLFKNTADSFVVVDEYDGTVFGAEVKTDITEILNAVLTDEDKKVFENGMSAEVEFQMYTTTDTVDAEIKEAIEKKANATVIGIELFDYVDIAVTKTVGTEYEALEETNKPITFGITIAEAYINKDNKIERVYYVIRYHDGEVEFLDAKFDPATNQVIFASDKFSTFAIGHKDIAKPAGSSATPVLGVENSTNKMIYLMITFAVMLLAGAGAFVLISKKRK